MKDKNGKKMSGKKMGEGENRWQKNVWQKNRSKSGKKMVRSAELCSAQSEGTKKIGIGGNRLKTDGNRRMNRLNHEGGKGVFRV